MKVAHPDGNLSGNLTLRELADRARVHESEGEFDPAIKIYLDIIRKKPLNEMAYQRLMIVYRKLKEFDKEIAIIDKAIDTFSKGEEKGKKHPEGKIGKLSLSLGKLTGLIDRKGKSLYDPEPVSSWKKRKQLAQKRLKTKKK